MLSLENCPESTNSGHYYPHTPEQVPVESQTLKVPALRYGQWDTQHVPWSRSCCGYVRQRTAQPAANVQRMVVQKTKFTAWQIWPQKAMQWNSVLEVFASFWHKSMPGSVFTNSSLEFLLCSLTITVNSHVLCKYKARKLLFYIS
jgi:hypothetical protein